MFNLQKKIINRVRCGKLYMEKLRRTIYRKTKESSLKKWIEDKQINKKGDYFVLWIDFFIFILSWSFILMDIDK